MVPQPVIEVDSGMSLSDIMNGTNGACTARLQNGREFVIMASSIYEQMHDARYLNTALCSVRKSVEDFEQGRFVSGNQSVAQLREKFGMP